MGKWRILLAFFCILSLLTALSGCRKAADTEAGSSGSRDNTPQVLVPTAPGTSVIGNERISLDISNTAEGYLCARYAGSASRIKIFIITPDEVKYTYDLTAADDWAVLPLTGGNGVYQIEVYENVEGTSYSTLFKEPSLSVSLNDEFRPFLYPNQYTWFTADSETVKKAAELAQNADSDLDVITNVYNFTIGTIVYDDDKAAEAETGALAGYLPDVDQVLESGKGICFDYAAVMTAMLRSQGIPVKLEIGYSGEAYHAWISAWVDEIGWVDNVIQFDGKSWTLMDPTLAANNSADAVKKYVGDGSNYIVKYSR
ncbi:MAG TPA: transglutaminase-like domain-containing protein [Candidatus Fusicatenibacter intestinigallinarum]|uniref:Transglutaminase-like domain-containing protein n=1 Tax=Candidatus Fusicatenibacter intestinigallinarum TaxID=2838598 RepID=A0A9D2SKZ2_9FIRM|nr:transglutaminase-like domain-containing protein [Candidatus Fusicatenibacter intestinigallinarum]